MRTRDIQFLATIHHWFSVMRAVHGDGRWDDRMDQWLEEVIDIITNYDWHWKE